MTSMPRASRRRTNDLDAQRAVADVSARLREAGRADPEAILQRLGSRRSGLAAGDAAERLERLGQNETAHETSAPWYRQLLGAFVNPFIGILAVLALTSYVTEVLLAAPAERDASAVVIILFMIAFAVLLTFAQEYRASRAADALLSLVQPTARVRRDGELHQVATAELVPGDVVRLAAGDAMPADAYLLEATNLLVNEASLTGESLPVEKRAGDGAQRVAETAGHEAALDLETLGYMGTYVVSGTAEALILATGGATYLGSMASELVGRHPPTSFDRGVRSVSVLLIRFMLVMVPLIIVINGLTKGDWWQALLFGLARAGRDRAGDDHRWRAAVHGVRRGDRPPGAPRRLLPLSGADAARVLPGDPTGQTLVHPPVRHLALAARRAGRDDHATRQDHPLLGASRARRRRGTTRCAMLRRPLLADRAALRRHAADVTPTTPRPCRTAARAARHSSPTPGSGLPSRSPEDLPRAFAQAVHRPQRRNASARPPSTVRTWPVVCASRSLANR